MSKQKREKYGTFVTKRAWYLRRKPIAVAGISAAVLILTISIGVLLFNKDKSEPLLSIPEAKASDMPGWWYKDYFGSSVCEEERCESFSDPDSDGLNNAQEFYYHTNPLEAHTVGDKLNDGELVALGFDPSKPGKVTFDELLTDDSFIGESLVFDKDVKEMVAEANNIDKVNLHLPKNEELRLIKADDQGTYRAYAYGLSELINRYFPRKNLSEVKDILKSGGAYEITDIQIKSEMLVRELKALPVPARLLMFHKYNVASFELLPKIILPPTDISGTEGDLWFEYTQAFLAVQQRLGFEYQAIKTTQ